MGTEKSVFLHIRRSCLLIFAATAIFLILSAQQGMASGEPVTARFQNSSGSKIVIKLMAHKPVPSSVILTVRLPKGISLTASAPPHGKYDRSSNQAKWLLRGLSPGTHTLTLHLSSSIDVSALKAELRYLDSTTGKLLILPVKE